MHIDHLLFRQIAADRLDRLHAASFRARLDSRDPAGHVSASVDRPWLLPWPPAHPERATDPLGDA